MVYSIAIYYQVEGKQTANSIDYVKENDESILWHMRNGTPKNRIYLY